MTKIVKQSILNRFQSAQVLAREAGLFEKDAFCELKKQSII